MAGETLFDKKYRPISSGSAKVCTKCHWTVFEGNGSQGVMRRDCPGGRGCLLKMPTWNISRKTGIKIEKGRAVVGGQNGKVNQDIFQHTGPYFRGKKSRILQARYRKQRYYD